MAAFRGSSSSLVTHEQPKDYKVPDPPDDGITTVAFSPVADYLAVTSWDSSVRIYEVNAQAGYAAGKALYQHPNSAVLGCTWSKDGTRLFSCGTDKTAKMFELSTQQTVQVAQHDAPIRCIKWVEGPGVNVLATGSWDKTLKYWDLRSSTPVVSVDMPERCFAMDIFYPHMVVGTAERHVLMYNMQSPNVVYKNMMSPLKWQTRCISCFINGTGYAIGSIEGRVGIQYFEEKDGQTSFSFKCHRDNNGNVYAVNAISFHPLYGTFSTAGSDGCFNFWDKDSKQRLKGFSSVGSSISATTFNRNGQIFAYAASYDWSKGFQQFQQQQNLVYLHAVKEEDVKPRKSNKR